MTTIILPVTVALLLISMHGGRMNDDIWFQYYVACFSMSQKIALPSPIPDNIKAYLRGTFRAYWIRTCSVIGAIFLLLNVTYTTAAILRGGIQLSAYLHCQGTIALITVVCFTAWTIGYYLYTVTSMAQDIKHIVKNKRY